MKILARKEEGIRLKIRNRIWFPVFAKYRRNKLKCTDFTIISNNCWGGSCYESYDLKKMSPTVGMFFMPDDYLKFVKNIQYYLNCPLKFIKIEESKHKEVLGRHSTWGKYLIGCLDDVEVHLLHYHDEQLALIKWTERVKRVNFDRLIVKMNDNNGATLEHIKAFMDIPIKNKLCFVSKEEFCSVEGVVFIKQPKRAWGDGIAASREPFGMSRKFNVTEFINNM